MRKTAEMSAVQRAAAEKKAVTEMRAALEGRSAVERAAAMKGAAESRTALLALRPVIGMTIQEKADDKEIRRFLLARRNRRESLRLVGANEHVGMCVGMCVGI